MQFLTDRRTFLATIAAASAVAVPAWPQSGKQFFLIFFDYNEAARTEWVDKIVDSAIAKIPENGRVTLIGHCDNTEPNPEKLGFARANTVLTQFLRNPKMTKVRFNVTSKGASKPLVPVPANTREPQNRRVEIIVD